MSSCQSLFLNTILYSHENNSVKTLTLVTDKLTIMLKLSSLGRFLPSLSESLPLVFQVNIDIKMYH